MPPQTPPSSATPPPLLHPFTGRDVPWLLRARAEAAADKPFFVFAPFDGPAVTWRYGEFHRTVGRLAQALVGRGVAKGAFVLLHMENCPEFMLTWHACARVGAVVVTTNTRSAGDELAYFSEHCGARHVVTQPKYEATLRAAAVGATQFIVTDNDAGQAPDRSRSADAIAFESLLDATIPEFAEREPEAMLPLSVQYTSGTTSRPKGVVWTHANALWGGRTNSESCGVSAEDIGHTCLPLFHTNALCYTHLASLWAGASFVLQPRFSARRYWDCVKQHACTWGVQIPFMLKALAGSTPPEGLALSRWGLGAINTPIASKLGFPTLGWFGMTETIGLPIVSRRDVPGRVGTMGAPSPYYAVEVRREDGTHVAFGEVGALWVKGQPGLSLFLEYLNAPEATAAAFDERGWFATGDRVTPFEDGHIRFEGRKADMLRIGAENVAESEIERVILSAAGVAEVAVVGKPHPMLDESAVAFVIPSGSQSDAAEALVARIDAACLAGLADFKRPTEIHIVDALPRVTLGKIDKKALRARLLATEGMS